MRDTKLWAQDLEQAVAKKAGADDEIYACVNGLRGNGVSWERIGQLLGMTRQAAWEKYGHLTQAPRP